MSKCSNDARESFQNFLAIAFAVQESGLDTRSLSALLELQRSTATGEPALHRTIQQAANREQNVVKAMGITRAPIRGDKLVYRAGSGSAANYVGELASVCGPAEVATTIERQRRSFRRHKFPLTIVASFVAVLIIASRWIPYETRPASPMGAPSPKNLVAAQQQIAFVPSKATRSSRALKAQNALIKRVETKAPSSAFRQVQVGPNEVDYIAEDVTVRHFTTIPKPQRAPSRDQKIPSGTDVTVRYFASKPRVVPQAGPVSAATR